MLEMNLIIGGASGYNLNELSLFISSALLNTTADLAIICDSLNLEEQFCLKRFPRIKLLRIPKLNNPREFATLRYKAFLEYLASINRENYNMVLLSDCKDVYFQSDPFGDVNGIIFASEPRTIENCPTNRDWIMNFFPNGDDFLRKHGSELIICCGTILGDFKSITKLLQIFTAELDMAIAKIGAIPFGLDQSMLIKLIYENRLNLKYSISDPCSGFATTLHYHPETPINMYGQIVDTSKTPVPVIHQIDRRPWLEKSYREAIQLLTENK